MTDFSVSRALEPLAYHGQIVAWLREVEPEVWAWAESNTVQAEHAEEMRAAMLRNSYRLEAEAHPKVHAACQAALAALGLHAPVTLYQAADGAMNASLCYIPGEIHLVFYGPILERLSDEELLALMGHELAHYRLWAAEDGAFHAASRILDQALSYPGAEPAHIETARLFGLHTELYADRGAALAAGAAGPAISTLVKVMTGMANVDAASYLRQAAELEKDGRRSQGDTHPEVYLRAQALDRWWNDATNLEDWLTTRVRGPLSFGALDMPRQKELLRLTRSFFAWFLSDPDLRSEEVVTQVRRLFPDWTDTDDPAPARAFCTAEPLDGPTADYFIALMFDCATADPDGREALLLAAGRTAKGFGALEGFKTALKRDLKLGRAEITKLAAQIGKAAA